MVRDPDFLSDGFLPFHELSWQRVPDVVWCAFQFYASILHKGFKHRQQQKFSGYASRSISDQL